MQTSNLYSAIRLIFSIFLLLCFDVLPGKRLLDNIAEAFSPRSPSKSPSKSPRKEESIKRSKSESKENIPASALDPQEKKKGAGRGRRHKLYSDDYISEPFETTGDFVVS